MDGRKAVHNPDCTTFPWCVHGHLEMRYRAKDSEYGDENEDRVYVGSASMIGRKCAITAAHNLYIRNDTSSNKEHRRTHEIAPYKVDFYPGKDASENSEKWHSESQEWEIASGWKTSKKSLEASKSDFAVIMLKRPLGKETGWYSARPLSDQALAETTVTVTGYPYDLPKKNPDIRGKVMFTMDGSLDSVDSHHMYYKINTGEGQSGSGVWVNTKPPYYVGVHVAAAEGASLRKAVRFTDNKITKYIAVWRKKYGEV